VQLEKSLQGKDVLFDDIIVIAVLFGIYTTLYVHSQVLDFRII